MYDQESINMFHNIHLKHHLSTEIIKCLEIISYKVSTG
jgi:hypothetical protein